MRTYLKLSAVAIVYSPAHLFVALHRKRKRPNRPNRVSVGLEPSPCVFTNTGNPAVLEQIKRDPRLFHPLVETEFAIGAADLV